MARHEISVFGDAGSRGLGEPHADHVQHPACGKIRQPDAVKGPPLLGPVNRTDQPFRTHLHRLPTHPGREHIPAAAQLEVALTQVKVIRTEVRECACLLAPEPNVLEFHEHPDPVLHHRREMGADPHGSVRVVAAVQPWIVGLEPGPHLPAEANVCCLRRTGGKQHQGATHPPEDREHWHPHLHGLFPMPQHCSWTRGYRSLLHDIMFIAIPVIYVSAFSGTCVSDPHRESPAAWSATGPVSLCSCVACRFSHPGRRLVLGWTVGTGC